MLAVSIPNFPTSDALVETATKCFATDFSSPRKPASDQARAVWAFVIVSSVVKVFEEMMKSVSDGSRSLDGLREVGAVDIRYKAKRHGSIGVILQSLVGHYRPQVGAADADVDHVTNTLAGVPLPFAASHPVGEVRHPVEHGMHLGHHVFAIHNDGRVSRCPQGRMQNRSLLGDVDLFSTKHGVDSFPQSKFLGELDQQFECFVRDAILRVIEIKAHGLDRQTLAALGIVRKKLSQV